jgi:hypothetical protein
MRPPNFSAGAHPVVGREDQGRFGPVVGRLETVLPDLRVQQRAERKVLELLLHAEHEDPQPGDRPLAPQVVPPAERKDRPVHLLHDLIQVRQIDRVPDGLAADLDDEAELRVEEAPESLREVLELGALHLDVAPVVLPGVVVDRVEHLDLAIEPRDVQIPDPHLRVARQEAVRQADHAGSMSWRSNQ